MKALQHQYILIGIEPDPAHAADERTKRPALLDRVAAEQVLAQLAGEVNAMLPAISQCTLTMAGALFDQTEILQPRLPVYAALESLQHSSAAGESFQPRLLSIGASDGQMPHRGLQPNRNVPQGGLQILPILVTGTASQLVPLAQAMENLFLSQGQLTPQACNCLRSQFHIAPRHARFMTVADLNALLRLQLELFGFLPLWELLDTAINLPAKSLAVTSAENLTFEWTGGAVHSYFETFDWWAINGAGKSLPATDDNLPTAYANWTREYRRYLTMLSAHGVVVKQHLAGHPDALLDGTFFLEESTMEPAQTAASVTEHNLSDLGTVAVTVKHDGRLINFYPLHASGLNDLQAYIQAHGWTGSTAFPGRLCIDLAARQLSADTL